MLHLKQFVYHHQHKLDKFFKPDSCKLGKIVVTVTLIR